MIPKMMPAAEPMAMIIMDSIDRSFVMWAGRLPRAIMTPNSLFRSKIAMKKVFRMLKATTTIKTR